MKPISEWTDDELRFYPGEEVARSFAAEVLRLRAVLAQETDARWHAQNRAEKAEARGTELEAAMTAKPGSLEAAIVAIKRGNDHLLARAEKAEAALARVQALADRWDGHQTGIAHQIRAAIEGTDQ